MKHDTQHLDFLVSQYVDDTLDAANRKTVEQQINADPVARALFKDHQEVQDVLDDWGNRLPLINWEAFDQKLALRLESETVAVKRVSMWRRHSRPMSIAAGVVLALTVGLGVFYHNGAAVVEPTQKVADNQPSIIHVEIGLNPQSTQPSSVKVVYPESVTATGGNATAVITQPENVKSPTEGTAFIGGATSSIKSTPSEPH